MTDFADLVAAIDALKAAERGDLAPLTERLDGGKITRQECSWLAAYLRGEHKQRKGRPRGRLATGAGKKQTAGSEFKSRFPDKFVLDLFVFDYIESKVAGGLTETAAKKAVADRLGETIKSVEQRLIRVKKHLGQGGTRLDYLADSDCDKAKRQEVLDKAAELLDPIHSRRGKLALIKLGRLIGDDGN